LIGEDVVSLVVAVWRPELAVPAAAVVASSKNQHFLQHLDHPPLRMAGQRLMGSELTQRRPMWRTLEHHQSWKCWRCHCVISSRKKQQPGVQDALQSTALFHGTVHTHLTRSVVSPKLGSPTGGLPVTSSRRTTPKL
jgi:hypothetical protein